jgi:hypothetical protein
MNLLNKIRGRFEGISFTILRFPLTLIFLLAAVINNIFAIHASRDDAYVKLLVTFLLGATISTVLQLIYERFYQRPNIRRLFMGLTILLTTLYYLLIRNSDWSIEVTLRTIVLQFILTVAFIWVPVIKNKYDFNHSFMAGFKSIFSAGFFTGILFLGTVIIFQAINSLIVEVHDRTYIHSANLIFVLLAPIYFLSLIPVYSPKKETDVKDVDDVVNVHNTFVNKNSGENTFNDTIESDQEIMKYVRPTKFLEKLLTYVIIPITVVFTIILLLYILMNITDDFWTNNLMEPLLVSYSITVIIVYVLAASLDNTVAIYFRKLFPKILIPVVLFQTLSSVLKISENGITYGRYYVILFGVFATIAGVLFSILPIRKNGIIAPILITLSIISILPPVDAFTISKINQIGRLKQVLIQNQMLENNNIKPNTNISEEDKNRIKTSLRYLNQMNYINDVTWLSQYRSSLDFKKTFGFEEYESYDKNVINVFLNRDTTSPINVDDYDYFLRANLNNENKGTILLSQLKKEEKIYTVEVINDTEQNQQLIIDKEGQQLITFDLSEMYSRFITNQSNEKSLLSTEELTFTKENNEVILTIVAENITINQWSDNMYQMSDINILIKIK